MKKHLIDNAYRKQSPLKFSITKIVIPTVFLSLIKSLVRHSEPCYRIMTHCKIYALIEFNIFPVLHDLYRVNWFPIFVSNEVILSNGA